MTRFIMAAVAALTLCGAQPASAAVLKWAPATGVNFTDSAATTATVEVRGHIYYSKTGPLGYPYPANSYNYSFHTHNSSVCGNSFCTSTGFYGRLMCLSGLAAGEAVTVNWDMRLYFGPTTFNSCFNLSDQVTFLANGVGVEVSWGGGTSGTVSSGAITYEVGEWQTGSWTSTTTTGAL